MGYDVTMIVVEKSPYGDRETVKDTTKPFEDGSGFEHLKDEKGEPVHTGRTVYYCSVIAVLELCGIGGRISKLAGTTAADRKAAKTSSCYFFSPAGDGNTEVMVDRYGDQVREREVDDVIEALEKDIANDPHPYRRLPPALAVLKSVKEHWGHTDRLKVLFYAH